MNASRNQQTRESKTRSASLPFGSYLVAVYERDIDILLMEEFHADAAFVHWFCLKLNLPSSNFVGEWHSVSDNDGETGLLLLVQVGSRRVGVLIENKIVAPEMPRKDERYHKRSRSLVAAQKLDAYVTCICAPQSYLDGFRSSSRYGIGFPMRTSATGSTPPTIGVLPGVGK